MIASKKLIASAAAVAFFVAPLAGAIAQTRPYNGQYGYAARNYGAAPFGGFIDWYGTGWRNRDTMRGWDNTCLNVPWLPNQFACSPR